MPLWCWGNSGAHLSGIVAPHAVGLHVADDKWVAINQSQVCKRCKEAGTGHQLPGRGDEEQQSGSDAKAKDAQKPKRDKNSCLGHSRWFEDHLRSFPSEAAITR